MGCGSSTDAYSSSYQSAAKNEVDEQLAQMQEEERMHYKVRTAVSICLHARWVEPHIFPDNIIVGFAIHTCTTDGPLLLPAN